MLVDVILFNLKSWIYLYIVIWYSVSFQLMICIYLCYQRSHIVRSGHIKPRSHQPSTKEVTILTGRVANVQESVHGKWCSIWAACVQHVCSMCAAYNFFLYLGWRNSVNYSFRIGKKSQRKRTVNVRAALNNHSSRYLLTWSSQLNWFSCVRLDVAQNAWRHINDITTIAHCDWTRVVIFRYAYLNL